MRIRLHDPPAEVDGWAKDMRAAFDVADESGDHPDRAPSKLVRRYLDIRRRLGRPGNRPVVVCLCGSTRFRDQYDAANRTLTLAGRIVLSAGVFSHAEGIEIGDADKAALDALHLAKIDLADEVFVVDPGGYIGASTAAEIAYATAHGKHIGYLVPPDAA